MYFYVQGGLKTAYHIWAYPLDSPSGLVLADELI